MKFGIPAETRALEKRVAATPETVGKLIKVGYHQVVVQAGAGSGASIPDEQYTTAGATIASSAADVYAQADIVLKVRGPDADELALLKNGQTLIGLLNPHNKDGIAALAKTGVNGFAMEALPRIFRELIGRPVLEASLANMDERRGPLDRKSTRLNSSHSSVSRMPSSA